MWRAVDMSERHVRDVFLSLREDIASIWPDFDASLAVEDDESCFPLLRNYAYAENDDGKLTVAVSTRLMSQPIDRVWGVLAHEAGHLIDYFVDEAELKRMWRTLPATSELRADFLADHVLGFKIGYDKDDVQTIRGGETPRPARLGL